MGTRSEFTAYSLKKSRQKRARAELCGLAISPQSVSPLHRQDVSVQPASPSLRLDKARAMIDASVALG